MMEFLPFCVCIVVAYHFHDPLPVWVWALSILSLFSTPVLKLTDKGE